MNSHSSLNAAKRKASGLVLLVFEDGHTTMLHTRSQNYRIEFHHFTFTVINKELCVLYRSL